MFGWINVTYTILAVASVSVGYWAGANSQSKEQRDTEESEALSESLEGDRDISSVILEQNNECKLVLVVRTDLRMSSGKIAAQCSHATLACYKTLSATNLPLLRQWERTGQKKVALRCTDEEELLLLQAQAQSLNLCARSIQDAGRTQIAAGSRTVLGIAGPTRLLNQVTGNLQLL